MKKNYLWIIAGAALFSAQNVTAQCTVPTSVIATPSAVCAGAQVTLNASSPGSSIAWYTSPTGGVATGTSASGANFTITAANTTTYYAEAFVNSVAGGTTTLAFTGGAQQVIVPPGVTQVTIVAAGAQGGSNAQGVVGGLGGAAAGILTVTPGDVLNVYVGGTNGFNGGGTATSACTTAIGGNGGGASDVRLNGTTLANRVIVAGGGGGAGGNRVATCGRGSGGGGGGGYYGGGGGAAWPQTSTVVPTGGDQSAGGIGGTSAYATAAPGNNGQAGSLGQGGNGGVELSSNQAGNQIASVGGVGGGTVGASGSYAGNFAGQSGAGGSSYVGGVIGGTTTAGTQTGDGQVLIIGLSGSSCVSASRTPVIVNVTPNPTVTVAGTNSVCSGNSTTLTASGATSYSWNTGASTASINVTPSITTTYTVVGSTNGCIGTATETITVNTTTVAIAGSTAVCSGNSVVLTASGAASYSWSTGASTSSISVSPTVNTVYNVNGLGSNGCSGAASTTVNVNTVAVTIAGPSTVCAGSSVTLSASGANTYTWNTGSFTGSIVVTPTTNTTYTTMGTSVAGCTAMATKAVTVSALPTPGMVASQSVVCVNSGTVNLIVTPVGGTFSGPNVSGNVFTPGATAGTFTPVYAFTSPTSGCTGTTSVNIIVSACTGLTENSALGNVKIYPNPSQGILNIEMKNGLNKTIEVSDLSGRVLIEKEFNTDNCSLDLSLLAKGIYQVKVSSNNTVEVLKVVKD
ncbi:MAG: T9SS type A sorting domain-containing protein [Sediminibacterium sp.]|nr:T9SS type A sorting domain-containing protein [Sediminibacterium sp.]